MLTYIAKSQRNKLLLEKNAPITISQEMLVLLMMMMTTMSRGCVISDWHSTQCPLVEHTLCLTTTFSFFFYCSMGSQSNVGATGYPHRPPSLRLETRRTSISMDDVVRRTSIPVSVASSPDSNLLRVQAHLPGRRHSDNTIQPPRILIAPSSPTTSFSLSRGPSAANLNARRHSSINMQDAKNMLPKVKVPKVMLLVLKAVALYLVFHYSLFSLFVVRNAQHE